MGQLVLCGVPFQAQGWNALFLGQDPGYGEGRVSNNDRVMHDPCLASP